MGTLALILIMFGFVIGLVGSILILVEAFREGPGWGIACLLLPGVSLLFVILHWGRAKVGFTLNLAGLLMLMATVPLALRSRAPEAGRGGDEEREDEEVASTAAPHVASGASCPRTSPPNSGFVNWCCTRHGWSQVAKARDCGTVYRPTAPCDDKSVGQAETTACASRPTRGR
jgi:hypothetical protein